MILDWFSSINFSKFLNALNIELRLLNIEAINIFMPSLLRTIRAVLKDDGINIESTSSQHKTYSCLRYFYGGQ